MKEKKTGYFPVSHAGSILFVVALLLIMPMYADAAKSVGSGGMDFEIPISELSTEKKASPQKSVARKPALKRKSAARAKRSNVAAAAPAQPVDQTKTSASAGAPQQIPLPSEALQPFRIFNVPYSFVVTGKSTVIKAVIYREADDLQAINCTVRVTETGALSVVKMKKVDGSRFTYAATLPEVAAAASSLRYAIVAIDASGTESGSPEFAVPVTFSPLVPGWQF
jgi:hypothetical protein